MTSIRKIHDQLATKKLSAVELTRDYLAAIKASDHNAYLFTCEERAPMHFMTAMESSFS